MGNLRQIAMVCGFAALAGCGGDTLEQFGGPTMGSTYSIQYVRSSTAPTPKELQRQVEKILGDVDR